ncbi:unnamed protein product, partial [Durusdinium trenchii]
MGSEEMLRAHVNYPPPAEYLLPDDTAVTGQLVQQLAANLRGGLKFITQTAHVLFPSYVKSEEFQEKLWRTLMTLNAYSREITLWKNADVDYVALGHMNLNIDNAFFWRTGNQQLDCGMFDLGGFGAFSLHHRLWWGINCAEYALISEHLEEFLSIFLETYRSLGGPSLDRKVLRSGLIITALENMIFMIASIPNCLTMCKSSEWPTIQDRHDPRISADVDGKSTLRTTLQVLLNGIRMLEEMHADEVLDEWISTIFVQSWGLKAKPDEVIFGAETCTTALSAPDPGLGAPIGPCWLCEGRDSRACVICGPVATSTEGPSGVGRPRAVLVRLGLELRVKREKLLGQDGWCALDDSKDERFGGWVQTSTEELHVQILQEAEAQLQQGQAEAALQSLQRALRTGGKLQDDNKELHCLTSMIRARCHLLQQDYTAVVEDCKQFGRLEEEILGTMRGEELKKAQEQVGLAEVAAFVQRLGCAAEIAVNCRTKVTQGLAFKMVVDHAERALKGLQPCPEDLRVRPSGPRLRTAPLGTEAFACPFAPLPCASVLGTGALDEGQRGRSRCLAPGRWPARGGVFRPGSGRTQLVKDKRPQQRDGEAPRGASRVFYCFFSVQAGVRVASVQRFGWRSMRCASSSIQIQAARPFRGENPSDVTLAALAALAALTLQGAETGETGETDGCAMTQLRGAVESNEAGSEIQTESCFHPCTRKEAEKFCRRNHNLMSNCNGCMVKCGATGGLSSFSSGGGSSSTSGSITITGGGSSGTMCNDLGKLPTYCKANPGKSYQQGQCSFKCSAAGVATNIKNGGISIGSLG